MARAGVSKESRREVMEGRSIFNYIPSRVILCVISRLCIDCLISRAEVFSDCATHCSPQSLAHCWSCSRSLIDMCYIDN